MPSRKRLGRDPDREAAPLLQRPVVRRPVADLVARPGDLVPARFIGLVGHRSSGERGSGPIRPTAALPKPRVAILHQRRSKSNIHSKPKTLDGGDGHDTAGALLVSPMPPGSLIIANVPLPLAVYQNLSGQAEAQGQTAADFMAAILTRAARQ